METNSNSVSIRLAVELQSPQIVAHDQKLPPICCTTQAANAASHMFTHWEVNRIRLASRVLFQRPAHYVPEATLRQHVQERNFPIDGYEGKRKKLTGLPFRRNVTNCGSMPQGRKGLIRSPLRSGTAGLTLSDQINNTALNTLHGV